ncbi:MAG TPA: MmgE/PrpD family protein [Reyranella sp.]|nr:MmgE/PrpD family protein [Reyranella sp.]
MSIEPPAGVTRALARYVVASDFRQLAPEVVREGVRAVMHLVGCAIGGCRHETIESAWRAFAPFAGGPQATLLGRPERTDILHAALLNGIASHVLDFDDTHSTSLVHPSGPVVPAVLALAEWRPVSGAELINAFVVGVEVECRVSDVVSPSHYELGWHATGTAGVFGAAAASARLLGLTEQQTVWALGIAATQSAGLREMFGSMSKSLHPGRAAQNGLAAALMAAQGYTSAEQGIEGKRGFAHVLSRKANLEAATRGLGETRAILDNTYKPFACGLVIHPVIDGCLQLRRKLAPQAADIRRIELRVNPLVLELTGKPTPTTGLEGKFSVFHSAAVALIDGTAGEAQYADARVRSADVVALRSLVKATADPALRKESAAVAIECADGSRHVVFVEDCLGSLARPMTDAEMDAKFLALCDGVLQADKAKHALATLRRLPDLQDAAEAARVCAA